MEQLSSFFQKKKTINYSGRLIDLSKSLIMGIINVTPDSFYPDSRYQDEEKIANRTQQIIKEGGSIIDLGAYSSRPHAADVSAEEEIERLRFALPIIKKCAPEIILSIDTFRAEVVEAIYDEFGTFIINDISAGGLDDRMFGVAGRLGLPYIAMHMKGSPQSMIHETQYDDFFRDITAYFADKLKRLIDAGVHDIILDPGYGFSKNMEQNYELLKRMNELVIFELPILVGVSRKRMIYHLLGLTADEALNGTTVINTIALQKGADILRVHDVKQAVECVKIIEKLKSV
ncbi:MAG: dihydropteroate synthase [Prevotellaceae bacterium]|jgi:dihydropteroate synthase|nr:dihydropteroate synthase [Prevotellaceae bacterium]